MTRPLLLDLFCGAGGAAVGYHRAGFDVVGVDNRPQPHYPFDFHRANALAFIQDWTGQPFDAIHASPPCQAYSVATAPHDRTRHPDLVGPTRDLLENAGVPYVIENVPGAPLRNWVQVCGSGLGMTRLRRHRWFESNVALMGIPCVHGQNRDILNVTGHGEAGREAHRRGPYWGGDAWRTTMGIDWMNRDELAQAIPPAYTEHIGRQVMDHVRVTR